LPSLASGAKILVTITVKITLNGEPFEIGRPLTVTELLTELDIDPRRIAVEHNLVVLKRAAFDHTVINAEDQIEIVNFVGGGAA
jgi:thiamine biosynthesis protein ThiS